MPPYRSDNKKIEDEEDEEGTEIQDSHSLYLIEDEDDGEGSEQGSHSSYVDTTAVGHGAMWSCCVSGQSEGTMVAVRCLPKPPHPYGWPNTRPHFSYHSSYCTL